MNLADVRAQLEHEITWRQSEVRLLHNQLQYILNEADQGRYRKALVVMLYAHYEGFCRVAFSIYVDAINREGITCGEANDYITAASLADAFRDFQNPFKKSDLFKSKLPDDTKLHIFARQVDLLKALRLIWQRKVDIPETVVDTESNLSSVVMRKILFRLGLPYDALSKSEATIDLLLQRRNSIAHGSEKTGLDEGDFRKYETAVYDVVTEITKLIVATLQNNGYRRAS